MGKQIVSKVTLSTGKVVLLREMKISDTEIAAQAVASRSNGDQNLLQILMQKELVKNLIVAVDDKKLSGSEKEDMDSLFSIAEYGQLMSVIKKITGDDMGKEPRLEVVSSGDT